MALGSYPSVKFAGTEDDLNFMKQLSSVVRDPC
uniref:Uncharacterized protein n=1 Tax=Arundo donax TaxID=35708 RepID=A0A0A8Z265_ARUDO